MTYARALRWTAGAAMATAALLVTAPAQAAVLTPLAASAFTPFAAPAVTPVAVSSNDPAPAADVADRAFEDLAGSSAGAGRERPGRPVGEPANPETVLAARPVPAHPRTEPVLPVPAIPAAPPANQMVGSFGTEPNERAADLAAHILPLGTGFALMGLGLGFMGMRLRRGM
ncbi:hypothetical protein [Streptomyces sp. NBC_00347]|uniref:hypothetical protein n=1 Tax=Streptomyces sp. NBC_00347 TaxID=2975721 RepID=UPI0022501532|nr:hypothetical protein [Streptomyces sp. NBC_00347]MCX5123900.1 hypothetical protein [Streptomyces sp. NBC_00347]